MTGFQISDLHGIAALGLATEVLKLTDAERRTVIDGVAEDTSDRRRWR